MTKYTPLPCRSHVMNQNVLHYRKGSGLSQAYAYCLINHAFSSIVSDITNETINMFKPKCTVF